MITAHYDSLLVKLVSHDRTFAGAIRKSVRALKEFRIHGIQTNMTFLINVLNHEVFQKGKCYTTFISETPELIEMHNKLDRTTKILEFLANKMVNVNPGPKPDLRTERCRSSTRKKRSGEPGRIFAAGRERVHPEGVPE